MEILICVISVGYAGLGRQCDAVPVLSSICLSDDIVFVKRGQGNTCGLIGSEDTSDFGVTNVRQKSKRFHIDFVITNGRYERPICHNNAALQICINEAIYIDARRALREYCSESFRCRCGAFNNLSVKEQLRLTAIKSMRV